MRPDRGLRTHQRQLPHLIAALASLLLLPPEAADLVSRLASELTEGNAAAFLGHFDRALPGYAGLESSVYALVSQADVGCSIEIVRDEGGERSRSLELDWELEITGKQAAGATERRRQTVRAKLERRGKKWVITALEPVSFFAPPKAGIGHE